MQLASLRLTPCSVLETSVLPQARGRGSLIHRARAACAPGFESGRCGAAQAESELDGLTPREREVLRHIARGYMYKEIALRLEISPKTVEAHVSSVLRKLQLSSRHELSRWAAEQRLLDP